MAVVVETVVLFITVALMPVVVDADKDDPVVLYSHEISNGLHPGDVLEVRCTFMDKDLPAEFKFWAGPNAAFSFFINFIGAGAVVMETIQVYPNGYRDVTDVVIKRADPFMTTFRHEIKLEFKMTNTHFVIAVNNQPQYGYDYHIPIARVNLFHVIGGKRSTGREFVDVHSVQLHRI